MSIHYQTDTPEVRAFVARLIAKGVIDEVSEVFIAGVEADGTPVLVAYDEDGFVDEWRE